MNIILIGDRASGKGTLGRAVAKRLAWDFLDVDETIEQRVGMSTTEFWNAAGEPELRRVETGIVDEFCSRDRTVIAFSAGAAVQPQNAPYMQASGVLVVYLEASVDLLWDRLQADPKSAQRRPQQMDGGKEEVEALYERRHPVYSRFANLVVDAGRPVEELVQHVLTAMPHGEGL